LSVALAGAALLLLVLGRHSSTPPGGPPRAFVAAILIAFLAFAAVGALIASRVPGNRVGWIFIWAALGIEVWAFGYAYALYALETKRGSLPAGTAMAWLQNWAPSIAVGLAVGFLPLLFPNGRLPSRRWAPVAWLVAAATALDTIGSAFAPGPLAGFGTLDNPLGLPGVRVLVTDHVAPLLFIAYAGSAASLISRFRRAERDERQQLKWFAFAAAVAAAANGAWAVDAATSAPNEMTPTLVIIGLVLGLAAIPVAAGFAILRYRLYDIDVMVNKTLVYGALAAFIGAVYVGVVVGIGSLVGAAGHRNLALSLAATALVAVAFQPVRAKVQQLANRLVYGKRVTPYEALAAFSHRVAAVLSPEDVLPRMAEAAALGVGAERTQVRLFLPHGEKQLASWPASASASSFDCTVPVVDQGELVGEIAVAKPRGEHVSADDERLLADLASQAGPALRSLRLTAELRARLQELDASRRRLVAAQDAERRRIERNIHDGIQQEVVALAARLGLARSQVKRDPALAEATLAELQRETHQLLKDIRELVHGIQPPVLSDRGLVEAIEARASRLPLGVVIDADPALRQARYPEAVEGAAYFLVSEALANVLKHASATSAVVRLSSDERRLRVEIADDGVGFRAREASGSGLTGLRDRIEAVGGALSISSAPGAGTTLAAELPVGAQAAGDG